MPRFELSEEETNFLVTDDLRSVTAVHRRWTATHKAGQMARAPPSTKTLRKLMREAGLFPPPEGQPQQDDQLPVDIQGAVDARDEVQANVEQLINQRIDANLRQNAQMRTLINPRRN